MKKTFAAFAAISAALLVGGCSSSDEPAATAGSSTEAVSSTTAAAATTAESTGEDAVFLDTIDPYWITKYGSNSSIKLAKTVCEALYGGVNKLTAIQEAARGADDDFNQGVHMVHAATTAYCPGFLTGS